MHRGIQPIEILIQPQRMEYVTPLDDSLAHRSAEATALVAQEREKAAQAVAGAISAMRLDGAASSEHKEQADAAAP